MSITVEPFHSSTPNSTVPSSPAKRDASGSTMCAPA
jgi:hypothetical protein